MRRIIPVIAFLAMMAPMAVLAQTAGTPNATVVTTCGTQTYPAGTARPVTQNTAGQACGAATVTPSGTQDVNIVQTGGVTQLRGAGAVGTGSERIAVGQDVTTIAGSAPGTAGVPSTNVVSVQGVSSGTTLPVTDTSVVAAIVAGYLTPPLAVTPSPSPSSAVGIAVATSASLDSCKVLKASAGNAYEVTVYSTDTAADWVMIFNAVSAPANGAVTPARVLPVSAGGWISIASDGDPPTYYSTGITVCLSSTGPFTKTAVAMAVITGKVQ